MKLTVILTVEAKDAEGYVRSISKRFSVESLEGVYISPGEILGAEYFRLSDKLEQKIYDLNAESLKKRRKL